MKRLSLCLAAMLAPLMLTPSAHALSCMQPDIQRELTEAIESDKVYHIFVGYFDAPQRSKALPKKQGSKGEVMMFEPSQQSETVNGYFSGFSLGKSRRADIPLERLPVQIKTNCAAHWCGQVPRADQKMIAFVQAQAGGPPLLTMGPCPHMSHRYAEDKEMILRRGL